jgi:hypothetical protein
MSDTEELLTGRAGNEAAQGYSPLQHAVPDEPKEPAIDPESTLAKHFQRPAEPDPVHRDYFDVQTGEPTPDNATVELSRAAKDISEVRASENLELEKQHNADLNQALDFLEQEQAAQRAATTPQPAQPVEQQQEPLQPEYQPQYDPEAVQAMDPQYDPELLQALSSPKVSAVLEQVNQGVQQTAAQYQQQLANAALTATASFAAAFPELNGLQPEQLPGALALINKSNPARAQEIARQYDRVSHLVRQNQQVAMAQQQQQQAQASEQFRQFAKASDDRFDATNKDMPKEQMTAIKEEALVMLKEYGLSDADLAREYNSNPLFRSAAGQQIMMEAAAYRLARKAVSRHRANPVPHVQRPAVAESVRIDDGAVASALARLNAPGGADGRTGLRNAAALVAARRGSR